MCLRNSAVFCRHLSVTRKQQKFVGGPCDAVVAVDNMDFVKFINDPVITVNRFRVSSDEGRRRRCLSCNLTARDELAYRRFAKFVISAYVRAPRLPLKVINNAIYHAPVVTFFSLYFAHIERYVQRYYYGVFTRQFCAVCLLYRLML